MALILTTILRTEAAFVPLAKFDTSVIMVGFNDEEVEKMGLALALIKKVVKSEEFKSHILNYRYKKKMTFNDNQGLSNEQIYQKILDGSETLNPGNNKRMDLEVELYEEASKTIGYTYPNVTKVWVNKKYFSKYTPVQVADNLFHEWLHKIGFDHAVEWNSDRKHTVPYAIGYIVEKLARKMVKEQVQTL